MATETEKLGFQATWSMAVGGMVGGGIFSVLGVVVAVSGSWAWLSFVIAGLIALCAANSYTLLALKFNEGGGAFTFLRDVNKAGVAGGVSWLVIAGYTLTIAVYGFTFGHYLANVFGLGGLYPSAAGVAFIAVFVMINLRGTGSAAIVELVTVWGKLFVLVGLGLWGLLEWAPERLTAASVPGDFSAALVGGAVVFMAFEGFQLLAYDYDDIDDPERTAPLAMSSAIIAVIVVYIIVTIGAVMLVGSEAIVEHEEVALASAGQEVAGAWGLWIVTLAAIFSTASAINATLFAVGRLARRAAREDEIPTYFAHENQFRIPDRAIITIGGAAALLSAIGSLDVLVEAASLGFLFTFSVVNGLALVEVRKRRAVSALGLVGSLSAFVVLVWRQWQVSPLPLAALGGLVLAALVGRYAFSKRRDHAKR